VLLNAKIFKITKMSKIEAKELLKFKMKQSQEKSEEIEIEPVIID